MAGQSRTIKPPKHQQTRQLILDQIRAGRIAPGEKLPNVRELMKIHGVSYSTVDRALRELTAEGFIERKWGSGNFVKKPANKVANIAMVFNTTLGQATHPYVEPIIKGALHQCEALECHLQLFPLPGGRIFEDHQESLLAQLLRQRTFAGVVLMSPISSHDLQQLEALSLPIASVRNEYPGHGVGSIFEDFAGGARQVADLLVDRFHHRRIALMIGLTSDKRRHVVRATEKCSDSLMEAIRQQLPKKQAPPELINPYAWTDFDEGMRELMARPGRPTALVFGHDPFALRAIELAESMGLSVPEDLSVLTWGDYFADSFLTAVRVPLVDLAEESIDLLGAMISGRQHASRYVTPQLQLRGSCGPAPSKT